MLQIRRDSLAWPQIWYGSSNVPLRVFLFATTFVISIFVLVTIIYRVWFHRLSKFPGPFLASASNLHQCWRYLQGEEFKYYQNLQDMVSTAHGAFSADVVTLYSFYVRPNRPIRSKLVDDQRTQISSGYIPPKS